jgi:hypothetical protein
MLVITVNRDEFFLVGDSLVSANSGRAKVKIAIHGDCKVLRAQTIKRELTSRGWEQVDPITWVKPGCLPVGTVQALRLEGIA